MILNQQNIMINYNWRLKKIFFLNENENKQITQIKYKFEMCFKL